MIKDCATSCDSAACNIEMEETARMFSSENPQEECFGCSYIEQNNGDVLGNVFCGDQPDKLENGKIACPMYANAACYTGTNAHYVSFQNKLIFDQDFVFSTKISFFD